MILAIYEKEKLLASLISFISLFIQLIILTGLIVILIKYFV